MLRPCLCRGWGTTVASTARWIGYPNIPSSKRYGLARPGQRASTDCAPSRHGPSQRARGGRTRRAAGPQGC
eukprot:6185658-Pleurochrysis_carterae.AAC.2